MTGTRHAVRALLFVAVFNLAFGAVLTRAHAVGARAKRAAKREYNLGKQAFDLARFREALGHYERAYSLWKLPGFFFNIGQCYRNLDEYGKAIFAFQQFLKYTPKSNPRRPAVRKLIRTLERKETARKRRLEEERKRKAEAERKRRLAQQQANQNNSNGGASVLGDGTGDGTADGTADGVGDGTGRRLDLRPPPPPRRRSDDSSPIYKKWWFWTLIAAAVGGGVAGVYFGARAGGSSLPDGDYLVNISR